MKYWTRDDLTAHQILGCDKEERHLCDQHEICRCLPSTFFKDKAEAYKVCHPIEVTDLIPAPKPPAEFYAGQLVWYIGPKENALTPKKIYRLTQRPGQESLLIEDNLDNYACPFPKDLRRVCIGDKVGVRITTGIQYGRIESFLQDPTVEQPICVQFGIEKLWCETDVVILAVDFPDPATTELSAEFSVGQLVWCIDSRNSSLICGKIYTVGEDFRPQVLMRLKEKGDISFDTYRFRPVATGDKVIITDRLEKPIGEITEIRDDAVLVTIPSPFCKYWTSPNVIMLADKMVDTGFFNFRVGQLVWCLKSGTTFYRQMHRIDEIDKDGVMLESGSCYDAAYLRPVALRDKVITTGIGKYGSRIPKGIEASIYAFSSVGNDPTPFQLINANSWEWVEPEAVMLAEDEPTAEMPAEFYEGQWIWCTDNSLQDLTEGKCYKVEHIRIDGALEVRSDRGSLQDYLPCRSYFRPVCERDKVIWKGLAGILSAGTLFYFESANNPEKHYDINPTDLYLQDKI